MSGGTIDEAIQRDDEWLKAQKEIEETRRRKEEEGRQEGGKTLFEVLQQNKGDYPTNPFATFEHLFKFPSTNHHWLTCQVRCSFPSGQAGSL